MELRKIFNKYQKKKNYSDLKIQIEENCQPEGILQPARVNFIIILLNRRFFWDGILNWLFSLHDILSKIHSKIRVSDYVMM